MAVTPNYGWPVPVATDYVKDGWEAISDLGNAIDTTVAGLGGGLTLVKTQTIGNAVSSVVVTNAFSATYDNYRIIISGGVSSNSPATDISMQMGSTTSGYGYSLYYLPYTGGPGVVTSASTTNWAYALIGNVNGHSSSIDIITPYLAKNTYISRIAGGATSLGAFAGYLNNTTSYTDFTITPAAGTLTGGTIKVYGYQN